MSKSCSRQPFDGVSRRAFLSSAAAGVAGLTVGCAKTETPQPVAQGTEKAAHSSQQVADAKAQSPIGPAQSSTGIPGPYLGKVREVYHPGSVTDVVEEGYTRRNGDAVHAMVEQGMKQLVGSDDAVEAWSSLFSSGDRVGIKVVPVGKPDSISSYELVREVIEGLKSAGVRARDIWVFERYHNEFTKSRYHENLPEGVQWECASSGYDASQLEIDGQQPGQPSVSHVAGYDPDVYRELAFSDPVNHDPQDDRCFRSHLSNIISKRVDKFISIPVLKDHRSAGITGALKNLSHGSVNNVARSHGSAILNQCNTFIPAMVSLPPIREKAVLQIMDGLVATWEGGPGNWNKTFATWQYKSLFFATDPVAMDRVAWEIIDAKRAQEGWPGLAQMGLDGKTGVVQFDGEPYPEQFTMRQPQHVPLASTLGLGVWAKESELTDEQRAAGKPFIDHSRVELT